MSGDGAGAHALLYLHVPDKMIAGQTYHGAVITSSPSSTIGGSTAYLATGSTSIQIPSATTIPYGKNHGLFDIRAVSSGPANVHAAHNGEVGLGGGTVFSPSSGPQSLKLMLPGNRTSAADLAALVFLLDGNGYPVPAASDVPVRLVPTGLIDAPHTVTVRAGDTHAAFPVRVQGSGLVTAASAGLSSDTASITYETDVIRVRLAAAPDVVLPGGTLAYTVWLERVLPDGARAPYHPAQTTRAELQTTDTDVVRLTETPPAHRDDNTLSIMLRDGRATGTIYAGQPKGGEGYAALTAVVPEYGVDTAGICVGTVVFARENSTASAGNGQADATAARSAHAAQAHTTHPDTSPGSVAATAALDTDGGCSGDTTETYTEYLARLVASGITDAATATQPPPHPPAQNARDAAAGRLADDPPPINHVRLWVHPDTTSAHAQGTIGFYHLEAETTRTATIGENGTVLETDTTYERLIPTRADGYQHVTISAAPPGVTVQPVHITHPTHHTNAYTFPLTGGAAGAYAISATAAGYTHTDMLTVRAPYESTYELQLVPLPVRQAAAHAGETHHRAPPLFLITITDSAGRIVDIDDEFGTGTRLISVQFADGSTQPVLVGRHNTGVIYGASHMPHAPPTTDKAHMQQIDIVATLEGLPGAAAPARGSLMPAGIPVSVELDVPPIVHAGELFPVAAHTVDSAGIPVARVQVGGTATGLSEWDESAGLGAVRDTDALVGLLHSVGGGAQASVTSFLNEMRLEIESPATVAAGTPFGVRASMLEDAGPVAPSYDIMITHADGSDAAWPHNQTSAGVFEILPATEGPALVTVRASADGFNSTETTVSVSSEMAVRLEVDAVIAETGTPLQVDFTDAGGTIRTTPYRTTVTEPQTLQFAFPEEIGSSYGLLGVRHEGALHIPGTGVHIRPGDAHVRAVATYESRIQVFVVGGTGTGIYPHGAPVMVAAEPGHVVPYLIPERFAHWEGAPGRPAEFVTVAERPAEYEAVFEPDYTRLLYLVAAAAAAAAYITYRRFGPLLSYRLGAIADGLRP